MGNDGCVTCGNAAARSDGELMLVETKRDFKNGREEGDQRRGEKIESTGLIQNWEIVQITTIRTKERQFILTLLLHAQRLPLCMAADHSRC